MEALGGRARGPRRGRGAAARPPAREYHRAPQPRMPHPPAKPCATPSLASEFSQNARRLMRSCRPHSRIYKRNSKRAIRGRIQLFTRLSALTSSGALKRRASGSWIVCGVRVTHALSAPSRLHLNAQHFATQ